MDSTAEHSVVAVPDDPTPLDEVIIGTSAAPRSVDAQVDPFEKIDGLTGINPAVKKRIQRMEKVHRGKDGAKSTKYEGGDFKTGYGIFQVVTPPYNLDYLARLFTASSPHYAAVKAKVSNIVGLGYDLVDSHYTRQVMEKTEDTEKLAKIRRRLQRAKSEIYQWIDSCNEDDEFLETLQKVYTDYEVTGNGYFEIGRTQAGDIGYIGHVPATSIRIREARDGFVQVSGNRVVFFRNFGDTESPNPVGVDGTPNEIIHIKKYSPINSFYGVPDVVAAIPAIAGDEFASRFNLDYFENKAVPRYVIVIKGGQLSPNAQSNIVNFFENNLRAKNHRTLYVPLPAEDKDRKVSFEMKPVEAGVQDASFVNYKKMNLNYILMAHRVPISKVGLAEGVSLAVARDADKTFKEQVCRPEQRIVERKLNKIFSEVTNLFDFKLNELTLTDEDTQSKIDERYLRMKVVVPNEIRARWGWPGLKDGDKPVDLKADAAAEQRAQAGNTRTRDQNRSANGTDSNGEGRNAKGEGRAQG